MRGTTIPNPPLDSYFFLKILYHIMLGTLFLNSNTQKNYFVTWLTAVSPTQLDLRSATKDKDGEAGRDSKK